MGVRFRCYEVVVDCSCINVVGYEPVSVICADVRIGGLTRMSGGITASFDNYHGGKSIQDKEAGKYMIKRTRRTKTSYSASIRKDRRS